MIEASPATLVAVWDRAAALPPLERSRVLLSLGNSEEHDFDYWTLGRCDAALARIYGDVFGDSVQATVRCSACDELLEFETTASAIFGGVGSDGDTPTTLPLVRDGFMLELQPLRLGDLIALPTAPERAFEQVLRRCVVDARFNEREIDVAALPPGIRDAISESLRCADPLADILIALRCAHCAAEDAVRFDIGTILWEALDRSARQTLADVHVLASAYGWPERDILALAETRRRRYLELVGE